jgi:hypothetical protein
VTTAAIKPGEVTGAHNIRVSADTELKDIMSENFDAVILPGGMPGAANLDADANVDAVLRKAAENNSVIAAICAAPFVLAKRGLLNGRTFTMYPGFDSVLGGLKYTSNPAEISGNTVTGTKNVRVNPVLNGSYYYFNMEGITALQMNDTVRAKLFGMKNGVLYCSVDDSFSVATYAYAMLNNASIDSKIKTVCANLLRYGASAQTYKGYRTGALVDAAMTAAHKAYLTDLDKVAFANNSAQLGDVANPAVTWLGKTLILDSKVTVKYVVNVAKFGGDASKLSLRVRYTDINGGAKEVTVTASELYNNNANYRAFSFDKLTAAELRTVMSVAVMNGNTQVSETMQFSVDTYGNNISGNLLTLCKAMLAYSDAARAQFS